MFQPDKETIEALAALNSAYRFVHFGATFKMFEGKPVADAPGGCRCQIIDQTTKRVYCIYPDGLDKGPDGKMLVCTDEQEALRKAIKKAILAPKPLTPSQEAERLYRENGQLGGEVKTAKSENDELRARLADMEKTVETLMAAQAGA